MKTGKTYGQFEEVPLGAVAPEGWLRTRLRKQARGLTGHIEVAGFPFDRPVWSGPADPADYRNSWWAFEQMGYWVDGAIRCGYLLNDRKLTRKALKHIDYTLAHPDTDGYLGPRYLRASQDVGGNGFLGSDLRWAHAVFFRALMAHHDVTGDRRVLDRLARHYLGENYNHGARPDRDICNIETELWLYRRTGNKRLLNKALAEYRAFDAHPAWDCNTRGMLSSVSPSTHGVTFNEEVKLAAIAYIHSGEKKYLRAVKHAYEKVQKDHMLVDGVHSASEHFDGRHALASHETCDIADFMWATGYLLMATGDAAYADRIERAAFNAAPGAVKDDLKALQYFSCPNQVVAARYSNHNTFFNGHPWMSFRPRPGTECCTGNVHRILPNYCARMWMRGADESITAMLYGPSTLKARVGRAGREVTVQQETDYPFGERIEFTVRCDGTARFPLRLRIPGWCRAAEVRVNGQTLDAPCRPGSFVTLHRTFHDGDRVTLTLPMTLKTTQWPGGGVAIERGPLVFSLAIGEHWRIDPEDTCQSPDFPAWNLTASTPWNYALAVDARNLDKQVQLVRKAPGADPWTRDGAPIELRVPVRRVRGWGIRKTRRQLYKNPPWVTWVPPGPFEFTPPLPDPAALDRRLSRRIEWVTLIPYGCSHLRLTVFPVAR